jgi:membrane-bound serine protease (ClpP class)
VALMLLGIGLMIAEAFIPAFGAFILGGATAFVIGSLLMFDMPGGGLPPSIIAGATLISAALFGAVLTLLVRARRRQVVTGAGALIGLTGRITGWAGSEGEVLVQGERWRARASQSLQPGQSVCVIDRDGLTLLVQAK